MQLPLVVVLGFASMAATFSQRMLEPLTAVISRAMHVDVATAVLVAPAFTFPYALGQLILGPLADAYGKVMVLRASVAVLLLASLASWFATDFDTLIMLRLIVGAAAGGLIPVALALIADRVSVDQRQVALSHFMSVLIITQIYTPPLSAAVTQVLDWHIVFLLAASIAALSLIILFWQINPNRSIERPPFSIRAAARTYMRILREPIARMCYFGVVCEALFIFGFSPHIAPYLEATGMGGVAEAGYILAVFGLGGIVYTIVVGPLARRYSTFTIMAAGGAIAGIGLLAVALSRHWSFMALAFFPIGFGFYMLHSGLQTRVTEVMPAQRASVVSLHAFFMFLGFSLGPLVFGWVAGLIGTMATLILCAVGILTAAQAVSRFLRARAA